MTPAVLERADTATLISGAETEASQRATRAHDAVAGSDVYGGPYEALGDWLRAYWRAAGLISKAASAVVENSARLADAYAELLVSDVETIFETTRRYLATNDSPERHIFAETAAGGGRSMLLQPARQRLAQLGHLEPNWDSYGAEPVSSTAIFWASRFLDPVQDRLGDLLAERIRPHSIAPLADGGVQLEWRGPGGLLEVEFGRQGEIAYLLVEGVEPNRTFEEADGVGSNEVLQLLGRVLLG